MTGLSQDIHYALRQMHKKPGVTAIAIVVLALGIGTTTGMLAIVQSVLVRPLAYRDTDRLVLLGSSSQADDTSNLSYPVTGFAASFSKPLHTIHSLMQLWECWLCSPAQRLSWCLRIVLPKWTLT